MRLLIKKELKLSTSPLAWWFLMFSLMTFIPGYPIMMGAFFICFGLFQSVQSAREADDIIYSALLPIRKKDVVKAKYLVTVFFQMLGFLFIGVFAGIRMTALSEVSAYVDNKLLAANLTYLGGVLLIYTAFNGIFLGGFFKTAYYYGKPFIFYIIVTVLIVGAFEAAWHFPNLHFLGESNLRALLLQVPVLLAAVVIYVGVTFASLKKAQKSFVKIDL